MAATSNDSQQWSILEKLLLAQCVYKFGEDNWPLISKTLRQNVLTSRTQDFFNQKNCSLEYFTMIEQLDSSRRFSAPTPTPATQDMPPVVRLARQLYLERMEELKAQIKADEDSFRKLVTEIDEIRSGKWDSKLKELIPASEMESNEPTPMQITDESTEQPVHASSESNGDNVPMTTKDESPIIDTKAEAGIPDQEANEPNTTPALETETSAAINEDINMDLFSTPTVTTSADGVTESDIPLTTADDAEESELNDANAVLSGIDDATIISEDQAISAELKPSTSEEAITVQQDSILEEETAAINEIVDTMNGEGVLEAVADQQDEIPTKRKHDDVDMMSVDASPKRARTKSKSPMPVTESTAEVITPIVEAAVADTNEQTPERKAETPATAAEETDLYTARVPNTPEGSMSVASNAGTSTVTTPGPSGGERKKSIPYSKELEQRQKSWLKNINLLWREISNHKNGAMFMNPIKENIAPRYYEIIKRPMDLKQIKQRIRDGTIKNTAEFERDVLLMLTNSLIYNKEGTEVYQMALEMLEDVQEQIRVFKTADAYSSSGNAPKDTSHGLRRRSIVSDGGSIPGDADNA
ncbi:hypothetical protein NQZ79_g1872 [Umbelopsis isabellina]|nr:hypothetical protein NQZ79_g1872 [Umbelopsis isabellina]